MADDADKNFKYMFQIQVDPVSDPGFHISDLGRSSLKSGYPVSDIFILQTTLDVSVYLFQGLMEMLDVEWADLYVYSDVWGEPLQTQQVGEGRREPGLPNVAAESYPRLSLWQVRIRRDRAFWSALLPHLWDFWFRHILPARAALQQHYSQKQQEKEEAGIGSVPPSPSEGSSGGTLSPSMAAEEEEDGEEVEEAVSVSAEKDAVKAAKAAKKAARDALKAVVR